MAEGTKDIFRMRFLPYRYHAIADRRTVGSYFWISAHVAVLGVASERAVLTVVKAGRCDISGTAGACGMLILRRGPVPGAGCIPFCSVIPVQGFVDV